MCKHIFPVNFEHTCLLFSIYFYNYVLRTLTGSQIDTPCIISTAVCWISTRQLPHTPRSRAQIQTITSTTTTTLRTVGTLMLTTDILDTCDNIIDCTRLYYME